MSSGFSERLCLKNQRWREIEKRHLMLTPAPIHTCTTGTCARVHIPHLTHTHTHDNFLNVLFAYSLHLFCSLNHPLKQTPESEDQITSRPAGIVSRGSGWSSFGQTGSGAGGVYFPFMSFVRGMISKGLSKLLQSSTSTSLQFSEPSLAQSGLP